MKKIMYTATSLILLAILYFYTSAGVNKSINNYYFKKPMKVGDIVVFTLNTNKTESFNDFQFSLKTYILPPSLPTPNAAPILEPDVFSFCEVTIVDTQDKTARKLEFPETIRNGQKEYQGFGRKGESYRIEFLKQENGTVTFKLTRLINQEDLI